MATCIYNYSVCKCDRCGDTDKVSDKMNGIKFKEFEDWDKSRATQFRVIPDIVNDGYREPYIAYSVQRKRWYGWTTVLSKIHTKKDADRYMAELMDAYSV